MASPANIGLSHENVTLLIFITFIHSLIHCYAERNTRTLRETLVLRLWPSRYEFHPLSIIGIMQVTCAGGNPRLISDQPSNSPPSADRANVPDSKPLVRLN
jgi:hypothetical protein